MRRRFQACSNIIVAAFFVCSAIYAKSSTQPNELLERSRLEPMIPFMMDSVALIVGVKDISKTKIERHWCNGVMIAPRTVVTAAHCFKKDFKTTLFGIKGRIKNYSDGIGFKKVFLHEGFVDTDKSSDNDLAVGCLEKEMPGKFFVIPPANLKIDDAKYDQKTKEAIGNQDQVLTNFVCAEPIGKEDMVCQRHDVLYLNQHSARKIFMTTPTWNPTVKKGESGSGFFLSRGNDLYVMGVLSGLGKDTNSGMASDLRTHRGWVLEKKSLCERK